MNLGHARSLCAAANSNVNVVGAGIPIVLQVRPYRFDQYLHISEQLYRVLYRYTNAVQRMFVYQVQNMFVCSQHPRYPYFCCCISSCLVFDRRELR